MTTIVYTDGTRIQVKASCDEVHEKLRDAATGQSMGPYVEAEAADGKRAFLNSTTVAYVIESEPSTVYTQGM